jgi:hypothetical protein
MAKRGRPGKLYLPLKAVDIATGRVVRPGGDSFVDDFTGERHELAPEYDRPRGLPTDARDYRDAVNRAKQARAQALLAYVFNPPQPKPFKRRI